VTGPIRAEHAIEIDAGDARFAVVEEGRRVVVQAGQVDVWTEVHRRTPAEVVIYVLAMRDPDLGRARWPRWPRATEEQPVPVGREVWSERVGGSVVDVWPEILRRSPRVVEAIALGNPNVAYFKTSWAVRGYVKTEAIVRDSRVLVDDAG